MNTNQAVSHFGSKKKLADALSISPSAVTLWGGVIPKLRQFQIQTLTAGVLEADALQASTLKESSPVCASCARGLDGSVDPSSTGAAQ